MVQLNEYETDLYFPQNFQRNMRVYFIIHVFCKSCKHDIVLAILQIKTNNFAFANPIKSVNDQTKYCIGLELLKENKGLSCIYSTERTNQLGIQI